jgi:hypothetical protein
MRARFAYYARNFVVLEKPNTWMLLLLFVIILSPGANSCFCQQIETTYPKTLWSPNDTFSIRYSNFPQNIVHVKISKGDTVSYGSDGLAGLVATLYYGKDSVLFGYNNKPFAQWHWIHIESPKGKIVLLLRFNSLYADFSDEYIQKK